MPHHCPRDDIITRVVQHARVHACLRDRCSRNGQLTGKLSVVILSFNFSDRPGLSPRGWGSMVADDGRFLNFKYQATSAVPASLLLPATRLRGILHFWLRIRLATLRRIEGQRGLDIPRFYYKLSAISSSANSRIKEERERKGRESVAYKSYRGIFTTFPSTGASQMEGKSREPDCTENLGCVCPRRICRRDEREQRGTHRAYTSLL